MATARKHVLPNGHTIEVKPVRSAEALLTIDDVRDELWELEELTSRLLGLGLHPATIANLVSGLCEEPQGTLH